MRAGRGWMEGKSFLAFAREKKDRYRTGTQHPIFFPVNSSPPNPWAVEWGVEWIKLGERGKGCAWSVIGFDSPYSILSHIIRTLSLTLGTHTHKCHRCWVLSMGPCPPPPSTLFLHSWCECVNVCLYSIFLLLIQCVFCIVFVFTLRFFFVGMGPLFFFLYYKWINFQ